MIDRRKAMRRIPLALATALLAAGLPLAPASAASSIETSFTPSIQPASALLPARQITRDPGNIAVFVNKNYPLSPLKYVPKTTKLPGTSIQLRPEAATAYSKMSKAAAKDGVKLTALSGYRSYARQAELFSYYTELYGKNYASRISAVPGASEHQTGLAIDVGTANGSCTLQECFAGTAAGKWVAKHGYKYGFIIRYPKGQEKVTGYAYEPWHLRYLGVSLAKSYTSSGAKSLEAYYGLSGTSTPKTTLPETQGTAKTTENLNLRSGAGTSHKIILTIPKGKSVKLTGATKNGWHQVVYNSKTGWVSGSYLSGITSSKDSTQGNTTKTTTANLNLRSGAGVNHKIILTIPKGKKVTITGAKKSGWYPVKYSGKAGWVSASYLK